MRVKIAWIVPGFSGDERDWCIPALLDLARVMAAWHEVHVFALHYPYRRDRYSVFGARVHAIGGANRRGWRLPGAWNALLREVTREHHAAGFDALHAFWVYEPGVLAVWLKRRLGVRTIVSLAGGELIDLPEIGYGYGGRRLLMRAMRWALRRADVVTAGSRGLLKRIPHPPSPSPETKQSISGEGEMHSPLLTTTLRLRCAPLRALSSGEGPGVRPRCVFAPLGVDTMLFASASGDASHSRHREMPPTLINVGSLQPVKGQADLIRAFRFVVDRHAEARLSIVGSGPLRAELEGLARELNLAGSVNFTGEVRHEQLPDMYREATVFVQASFHEAQGMAVLEAAACGVPIVGTPVGALADLAPDAAVIASPGDSIRLAQAILSVLDDPARRQALGKAARARVEQVYSLEAAAERFQAIYSGW